MQILLSSTQAGPGRKVKQEQEEISRNHVPRLFLGSVLASSLWMLKGNEVTNDSAAITFIVMTDNDGMSESSEGQRDRGCADEANRDCTEPLKKCLSRVA